MTAERVEVDWEAMLTAARNEAEMWRTAKDRMAERAIAAESDSEIWHKVARDEGFRLAAARDQIVDLEAQRDQLADIIAERAAEVVRAEAALDAIEAMLTKKKRMGTLFDVQQIRRASK